MVLGMTILLAAQGAAAASCLDSLDSFVRDVCISTPEIFEHQGGITQVYVCDVAPGTPSAVAMFSYDPDISDVVVSAEESCSGGSLYLDRNPTELSLLWDWNHYTDLIADG